MCAVQVLPIDEDVSHVGRVMEMLSEHQVRST
jgi:phosphoketolase